MLHYGGDYNPDLTDEHLWGEDIRLMNEAGINLVTLGVFAWAQVEPRDGHFEFEWLDRIVERLHDGGIKIDMASATASPPPWLSIAHPETLPEDADGVRSWPGSRQAYAPSSPIYRRYAARLTHEMAKRYAHHPGVVLWHANNELGCHTNLDYSDAAQNAFREWLEKKYGTIDRLNEVWVTNFWSQRYDSFDEIRPPRRTPTWRNPTQVLDFKRFSSDALIELFLMEKEIVKSYNADMPVLTNFIGAFKPVDYHRLAPHVDLISDDSYPDPYDPRSPMLAAFARELMRSLSKGAPWLLLEQAPGYVNWRPVNATKRAGQMRSWSMQALARGADGIMFFQFRQSRAGAEKFHSGLLPHSGERSRIWKSVKQLGSDLATLSVIEGSPAEVPEVGMLFDWENWWALEDGSRPASIDYYENVISWYRPFYDANIPVELIHPSADLSRFKLLVIPHLYLLSHENARRIAEYVNGGGRIIVTYFSALVDEHDHVYETGYLGELADVLGVWIDDFAALSTGDEPGPTEIEVDGGFFGDFVGTEWSEYLEATTAEVVARFRGNDLDGSPAITRHTYGDGEAWYVATKPDPSTMDRIVDLVRREGDVGAVVESLPAGVEASRRGEHLFVVNQSPSGASVDVPGTDILTGQSADRFELRPFDVVVLDQGR